MIKQFRCECGNEFYREYFGGKAPGYCSDECRSKFKYEKDQKRFMEYRLKNRLRVKTEFADDPNMFNAIYI